MTLDTVFGSKPRRGWNNLRKLLAAHCMRRLPSAPAADIDDAVSEAIASLVSYWAGLESSMTADVDRNWNFAVWRARRHAVTLLYKMLEEYKNVEHLDADAPGGNLDDGSQANGRPLTMHEYLEMRGEFMPGPPGNLSDDAYQEKVRSFIAEIPDSEMWWLTSAASGESVRGCAARTGKSKSAVQRIRSAGRGRLSRLACLRGVGPE